MDGYPITYSYMMTDEQRKEWHAENTSELKCPCHLNLKHMAQMVHYSLSSSRPLLSSSSSFLVLSMFSAATEGFMAHQCGLVAEEWGGSTAAFFFSSVCVLGLADTPPLTLPCPLLLPFYQCLGHHTPDTEFSIPKNAAHHK